VVLSGHTTLTADDLPEKFFRDHPAGNGDQGAGETKDSDLNLKDLSKQTILKALESCRGNRTEAAKQLGISRRTLHRRLNDFGLRD
jgi:two-component system response regulator HydG